jgi:hypothetical protein
VNQAGLHYEFLEERRRIHTFVQAGGNIGVNLIEDEGGIFSFFGRLGFLVGRSSNYLDASIGAGYYSFMKGPFLSSTVGFRNQNPNGNSIFRCGISIPDGLYLGYGWRLRRKMIASNSLPVKALDCYHIRQTQAVENSKEYPFGPKVQVWHAIFEGVEQTHKKPGSGVEG